jgi:Flp pilus assembly pilin Flp
MRGAQSFRGTIAAEWPQVLTTPLPNRLEASKSPHRSHHVVLARPFSRSNERGQALIEYAAIVAVVGACLVAILGLLGRATNRAYERTSTAVSQGKTGFQGTGGVTLTGISSSGRRVDQGAAEPPPDSAASAAPTPDSVAGAESAEADATRDVSK